MAIGVRVFASVVGLRTLIRRSLLPGLLAVIAGCATSQPTRAPLLYVLDQGTTQLEGWFSADGGDWTLYPVARIADYARYDREEDDKCVPLLNGTGASRTAFQKLEGKKVVVKGHTMLYDDLPIGPTNHDALLHKRYFDGRIVMNYCYRNMVFVADLIELVTRE